MSADGLTEAELLLLQTLYEADLHYGEDVDDVTEGDETEIIEYPPDYFDNPEAQARLLPPSIKQ